MSKRLITLVLLVVMALGLLPATTASAAGLPTDPIIIVSECLVYVEFDAQVPGFYTVNIWDAGVVIQSQSAAGAFFGDTLTFTFLVTVLDPTSAPGIFVEITKDGASLYGIQIYEFEAICNQSLATGCTPNIPANAVVGTLTDNTFTYWGPSYDTKTSTVLTVGKTWWVLGRDASGEFYKILVSCQPVWVPASVLGPNFDKVWNGRPLPVDIAK